MPDDWFQFSFLAHKAKGEPKDWSGVFLTIAGCLFVLLLAAYIAGKLFSW